MQQFSVQNGSSFLLHDTDPNDPQRVLIFGNRDVLTRVGLAETQLLTVHCFIYGQDAYVLHSPRG